MIIEHPVREDIPALRALWKQAFGDTDAFLDSFFSLAFSADRAMVAREDNKVVGALYWLDCLWGEKRLSYIYAVATDKDYRGRGICTALMTRTHQEASEAGKGTVLVPVENSLRTFYGRLGYRNFGGIDEEIFFSAGTPVAVQKISAYAYGEKRRELLPENSILQEGDFLPFLDANMQFYSGEGWLLAIGDDFAPEFLGNKALLPGTLKALQIPKASVRCAGKTPFAMYRGIEEDGAMPGYFAFALD